MTAAVIVAVLMALSMFVLLMDGARKMAKKQERDASHKKHVR